MIHGAAVLALRLMACGEAESAVVSESKACGVDPVAAMSPAQSGTTATSAPSSSSETSELAKSLTSVLQHVEKTERRHRFVRGGLRLGLGVAAFSTWLGVTLSADGRSQRLVGSSMLTATSPLLIPGIIDLSVRSTTEKVLRSPVIRAAMRDGWRDEDVVAVRTFLRQQSRRARRARILAGTTEALIGAAGVVIYSIAIPRNFDEQQPTAAGMTAYGLTLGGSAALLVRGISGLARPSGLEQLAASF